jgi:hypothetical protein
LKLSRVVFASAFVVTGLLGSALGAHATGTVVALNGQNLVGGGGATFDVQNTGQEPAGELCVNVGAYTPANNGSYNGHSDAFDVGLTLGVGGHSFIDSNGNGTRNGQSMVTGPEHVGGLIVTRIDAALPGSPTLRSLIRLKNATPSKVTRSVVWDSAMGSDGGDVARASSSGDAVFTKADRWFVDSENADLILDLIVGLRREQNFTLILVTHDLGIARQAARIIEMKDGRIVSDALNKEPT